MAEITIRISDKALKIAGLVLGGIVLAWLVSYSLSSGLFRPKYRLRMYVSEAAGLAVRAPVRLDGIDVGTVDAINPAGTSASSERRIEIVLRIEKRYENNILSDSTASFVTEGLLGNRYVSIQRGFLGRPIPPSGEIAAVPTKTVTIGEVMDSLARIADCLKREDSKAEVKVQGH